eukprot:5910635-Lingulodinium_polyedra.AAC.1
MWGRSGSNRRSAMRLPRLLCRRRPSPPAQPHRRMAPGYPTSEATRERPSNVAGQAIVTRCIRRRS